MAGVRLENIQKFFGDIRVLKDVNLEIADGEFCVFLGPSGCGKSTLLRMIAGLEEITDGNLYIGDDLLNETPSSKRGISMVFQSYALYPHKTVYENMAFALKLAKLPTDVIEQEVRHAAEILHLTELLDRRPKALSGGQRQRVAIGRAIVRKPRVFLFDEPLSNLDAKLRSKTRVEIAKLHKSFGNAGMIYVTHDQIEAMTLADKIVLLNTGSDIEKFGSVAQFGKPLELYDRPLTQFAAQFIGSPQMNIIDVKMTGEGNSASIESRDGLGLIFSGPRTAPVTPTAALGFRPEHTSLEVAKPNAPGALKVTHTEALGEASLIYLDTGDAEQPIIVRESGLTKFSEGDFVAVHIDAEKMHLFDEQGRRVN